MRRHALGLEPALEAVDVLGAQMLWAVDSGGRLVEKLEEALQPIDVLDDRRAHHGRRELPQRRSEGERQAARSQRNEIDQGRSAVGGVDREAQAGDGVRSSCRVPGRQCA